MSDDRAGSGTTRHTRTAPGEASLRGLLDLAADLFDVPVAAILGDGPPIGIGAGEARALEAFRDRVIACGDVLVVPDAVIDPRWRAGPAERG
ncbi:hypothetical protein FV219_20800, partial [Methylobacterium sp. WL122]